MWLKAFIPGPYTPKLSERAEPQGCFQVCLLLSLKGTELGLSFLYWEVFHKIEVLQSCKPGVCFSWLIYAIFIPE